MLRHVAAITLLCCALPSGSVAAQDVRTGPPVRLDTVKVIAPAPTPVLDRETLTRGHTMLKDVWGAVKEYYYDSTYRGMDTTNALRVADSAITFAPNQAMMMAALVQFLDNLHDSHTRFLPPQLATSVDYGWGWRIIGDKCFVVSVTKGSDAEKQGLLFGDQVLAIDRVQPTRDNIHAISYAYYQLRPRPGMHLSVIHPDGTAAQFIIRSTFHERRLVTDVTDNTVLHQLINAQEEQMRALHQYATIADTVLVWHFNQFVYQDDELDHLMDRARRHKVLILDLRGNGGGSVEAFTRLLGHFSADRYAAAVVHERKKVDTLWVTPQGRRPFTGSVIVLIDSRSASASEMVSRTLQMRRDAMIVGDRSMGAVMASIAPGLGLTAGNGRTIEYGISVSVSDPVMPDGNRLENAGVIPNVSALPTAQDLINHRDPAMQFALELAGVKMDGVQAAKVYEKH